MLDPEEYPFADSVIVSLVDFVRFPSLSNEKDSYRKKYQSQLWLFHITYLDDWFNLTATLKPESDVHVQYKVDF
jgi:hypothetical protein